MIVFSDLQSAAKKALIPYLTAGRSNVTTTLGLMHALVANGADLTDWGFRSAIRRPMARWSSAPLKDRWPRRPPCWLCWNRAAIRTSNNATPVCDGLSESGGMHGLQKFADACVAAGVDGVLLVTCRRKKRTTCNRSCARPAGNHLSGGAHQQPASH